MAAGLGEMDKFVVLGADAVGGGDVNDVGAEFFFNAGDKLVAAGVVALVDEVNAGLVKGDGVGGGQETDVGHTGSGGVGVAVAVNGDVDHGGDVGGAVLEIAVDAGSGVAHSGDEGKLGGSHIVAVGLAGAVDVFLAVGGSAADGKLFEGAAEAAHSVALEVGEDEQGMVVGEMAADEVLLDLLAVGDVKDEVGAVAVQEVNSEVFGPFVVAEKLAVFGGGVAGAGIGGVALHDGAVDMLNELLDVFGAEVVLVALLAGVEFDGGLSWQGELEGVVDFDEAGGGNVRGEIDFGFGHSNAPWVSFAGRFVRW